MVFLQPALNGNMLFCLPTAVGFKSNCLHCQLFIVELMISDSSSCWLGTLAKLYIFYLYRNVLFANNIMDSKYEADG